MESETSYTPGSVVPTARMAIHLDLALPSGSSSLPEGFGRAVLERLLLGLAPDEACHAANCHQRPGGLLHRRFTLTFRPKPKGGLFSVALSLRSPWADVIRHRALWSPEVPQPTKSVAAIKRSQTHNYTSIFEYKKPRKFIDIYAVCSRRFPKARLQ